MSLISGIKPGSIFIKFSDDFLGTSGLFLLDFNIEALAAASKGETNGYSVIFPTSFKHTGSKTEF